jgi:HSP20 family protein
MAITDLLPWNREEEKVPVKREVSDRNLTLRDEMSRLFDDFFRQRYGMFDWHELWERQIGDFIPRMDVNESESEIEVSVELPGIEREDIDIAINNNILNIRGEKRAEEEEKGKRYFRFERSYGSFHRSIPLGAEVDEDNVEATFKRGVLKVTLPKTSESLERSKRIVVKRG